MQLTTFNRMLKYLKNALKITNMAGNITIRKIERVSPEQKIFEFIENSEMTMKDWEEIQNERKRER